jgi:hypothetical protein
MGESRTQSTESADHPGSGETRRFLSRDPDPEGADLAPGSALRWPRCECGSPKCPDYKAPPHRPTEC